jgi:hypothetical protein
MITPVNREINNPGKVAAAMICPNKISDPVSSRTSQLNPIRLNPNPMRETVLPIKNKRNVGFFKIESMNNY